MTDDLVLEWRTLAELDAKPGDEVVHKGPGCELYTVGVERWLFGHKSRRYFPFASEWGSSRNFRLVSRDREG